MNKRFSTLLAAALVAGGLSASAAGPSAAGTPVPDGVKDGDNVLLRQVAIGGASFEGPLFIADEDGTLSTRFTAGSLTAASFDEVLSAVWKMTVYPAQSQNGYPTYKFVNKKTGQPFAIVLQTNNKGISTEQPVLDESGNQEWSWNTNLGLYKTEGDSTFCFVYDGNKAVLKAVEGEVADAVAAISAAGQTAFRLDPTQEDLDTPKDLTPAGFNTLVGETQKLSFNNGKDVKNPTVNPGNILTANKWEDRSASNAQDSLTSTDLFLTNTKLTKSGNPYMLMTDTLFYTITNTVAEQLNQLVCDTIAVSGTFLPKWEANGRYSYAIETAGRAVTIGTGADAKTVAIRPSATAVFTGKYYFVQDSMVLFAKYKAIKPTTDKEIGVAVYGDTNLDGTAEIANAGQIALKVLDANKIVLTPAVADISTEVLATNNNYIHPLIQVGEITPAEDLRASVDDGVYYIKNKDGQYLAAPIYNTVNGATANVEWVSVKGDLQEVAHMPAYQWVVLKNRYSTEVVAKTSPVTIYNREFDTQNASVQLMQKKGAEYLYANAFLGTAATDSLEFIPVDATILSDSLLGYKHFDKDSILVNRYTFNYLHEYANDKYIVKAEDDSVLLASDGMLAFSIDTIKDSKLYQYGFEVTPAVAERIDGLKSLYRRGYRAYIPTAKGDLYIGMNKEHKYVLTPYESEADTLLFKEDNDLKNNKHYYALLVLEKGSTLGDVAKEKYSRVSVSDDDVVLEDQVMEEKRVSAFHIAKYDAPLYRRFNSALLEGNEGDAADTLRFKEMYRGEYLQVEANENFQVKGIDFLGIYTPDFTKDGKSFIVDTTYINRGNGQIKPQYLISIDRTDQAFQAGQRCPICQAIIDEGGTAPANCPHDQAGVMPFHMGKYLVNFADSVKNAENKEDYAWKGYTRAGFVKAAHMGDSLYILTGQFADVTLATFDTAAIHKAVNEKKYPAKYVVNLLNDENKYVTWSMRFLDPENAANEVEEDRAFLMESSAASEIAPITGSWLKMQNGCLVMSGTAGAPSKFDQFTDDDDALIFNIEVGNEDDLATDNEEISASAVTVIAGNGQITIAGAAGKKVVVSNILGQVVANTVLTSDNATIAAPQGVVVVAVEGEEAVKAIVK